MAKRYHEQEVIDMLKAQVEAKKMLFMPNCGCGLTAKLQEKAAKTGFDWPDVQGVWDKFHEEWEEFRQALGEGNPVHAEEEAGDVLFVFANLCRHYHIEPECALHRANSKFRRRFAHVEDRVRQSGRPWEAFSLDELDSFWKEAKQIERQKENTDC